MADNKDKADRIHDSLPRFFKTRQNPNWNALVEALGEQDQKLTELIEEVRKQFFVKTASRPHLDKLGSNVKVSRPEFVGMDDPSFRDYIPVLAYQPKQVKLILDSLLDIFFFKEATTSFTMSSQSGPFYLEDGWELEYTIDGSKEEIVTFNSDDFSDIANATAEEVASAINRAAKHSFAVVYDDRIRKEKFVRLFTNTIGSKGSVRVTGGRSNISLQFVGFNDSAGSGSNTQWTITKVGNTMTFQHTGGVAPGLNTLQEGDVVIIDIPGNSGSFEITNVDVNNSSFSFVNLFGTAGTHDHSTSPNTFVNFMTPETLVVFANRNRAIVWEVSSGEIIVEMPASPPVVKRQLAGSAHINGVTANMVNRVSDTELELDDASEFPTGGGKFVLEQQNELTRRILTGTEDVTLSDELGTRFDKDNIFEFTSKSGNTLQGITPNLPKLAQLNQVSISSGNRSSSGIVTITTSSAHGFSKGQTVSIKELDPSLNGTFTIENVPSSTEFEYTDLGPVVTASGGVAMAESIGMSNDGSTVYLTTAKLGTGILGPNIWDPDAAFVLSSFTSSIQQDIRAGNNVRTLSIASGNNIPSEEGFVIFGFGTESEEGPVRYLFKPSDNSMQLDPAYVFKNNHSTGDQVTVIRRRGAHVLSTTGDELAPYITDPAAARSVLQNLLRRVKSVGIFIEFLIRFPEQLYATLDVYRSCNEDLHPINEEEASKCE